MSIINVNSLWDKCFELVTGDSYTNLENNNIWVTIWSFSASVDRDVLEPLDVRLWVAEHATHECHITTNNCSLVSGQSCLQDWSVRRTFWKVQIIMITSEVHNKQVFTHFPSTKMPTVNIVFLPTTSST